MQKENKQISSPSGDLITDELPAARPPQKVSRKTFRDEFIAELRAALERPSIKRHPRRPNMRRVDELVGTVLDIAVNGDSVAMKFVLERILGQPTAPPPDDELGNVYPIKHIIIHQKDNRS
jgi:hypothetical protein